jgi:hypothetical protein
LALSLHHFHGTILQYFLSSDGSDFG